MGTNELAELYDILSVLYNSLPDDTEPEWREALRSVLFGGDLLADESPSYGAQQNHRNTGQRDDYQCRHGNGDRITNFSSITVADPCQRDQQYLPTGAKVPVAPQSEEILPVYVSAQDIEWALTLLAEFPAEPAADKPGDGVEVLLDPGRIDHARASANASTRDDDATLLFVSDTHLGYERRSHTESGKTVSWIETLSSEETFTNITSIAIERDVDAILHTGDILDHEVDQDTLDAVERLLKILADHEIPIYFIIGSHDHLAAQPEYSGSVNGVSWLKSQLRTERMTELTTQPTPIGAKSISVYGISADNIGIDAVGMNESRGWHPSKIAFGASATNLNILCLHDRVTTYRDSENSVDLDRLLSQSRVAFDLVLIGDEHRPKDQEFADGYTFETKDGTPVLYTGPAMRISPPYHDQSAFVTELEISESSLTTTRHTV